jgi:hypothetical protein
VGFQPRNQLPVSDAGCGERFDTQHASQVVHHSSHMGISVSVDTADHGVGVSYDGHCHPSLHIETGVARTCRTGGPEIPGPGANRTGIRVSHPTGECRSRGQPAGHSKDNPKGVSRFASQVQPQEQTNRTYRPKVNSPTQRSAHPNPSSLPVLGRAVCVISRLARAFIERVKIELRSPANSDVETSVPRSILKSQLCALPMRPPAKAKDASVVTPHPGPVPRSLSPSRGVELDRGDDRRRCLHRDVESRLRRNDRHGHDPHGRPLGGIE